jgi:circadian clock protein KaiC
MDNSLHLEKAPTGIQGFEDIVEGGLPRGRTTLVCGGPGCGKTLMALEFLVHGAEQFNEPGVFIAFEETEQELATNLASLGIDLTALIAEKKLFVDYVYIERSEIEETGEYDLEGLFIRLASAIAMVGAKRVVLDTIETIFSGFQDASILRSELRRLFRWLKDHGVTAIVTGERGENSLTRYGLEEYVSDCVILLENRVVNKLSNRILRVVKYRGSKHGADEYPFLIGDDGIWVQPVSSLGLDYPVSSEMVSTGVPGLDEMLNGQGFYRGSSVLISGTVGSGKTTLAALAAHASCQRGERCLFFSYEESSQQIIRNMCSVGVDLQPWVEKGLLEFRASRPTLNGLEMHLLSIQKAVIEFDPAMVIIDPLSDFTTTGTYDEIKSMLVRLIDFLKVKQVTAVLNNLTPGGQEETNSEVGVSSLMDTWILLRNLENNGERTRGLYVLKSRGMPHSARVREFVISSSGIELVDVYITPEGVFTGSARLIQEAQVQAKARQRQFEIEQQRSELEVKRRRFEYQTAAMKSELEAEEERLQQALDQVEADFLWQRQERERMARARAGANGGSAESDETERSAEG